MDACYAVMCLAENNSKQNKTHKNMLTQCINCGAILVQMTKDEKTQHVLY